MPASMKPNIPPELAEASGGVTHHDDTPSGDPGQITTHAVIKSTLVVVTQKIKAIQDLAESNSNIWAHCVDIHALVAQALSESQGSAAGSGPVEVSGLVGTMGELSVKDTEHAVTNNAGAVDTEAKAAAPERPTSKETEI